MPKLIAHALWRSWRRWLLLVVLTTAAFPVQAIDAEDGLADLLLGLDRASRFYLDSVLRFSCDETIRESGLRQRIHKFSYIFIYDMKKGFVDYRTTTAAAERPVDPSKIGLRCLERSYFWVLIFHKTRQGLHRYKIEGREVVSGRATVRVSFEPLKPYKEKLNDWVGTAWVDPDTYQLLRVEAMTVEDHAAFVQMQEDRVNASHGRAIPVSRWVVLLESVTTDFSVEKNRMRFPGKTELKLTQYIVPFGGRSLLKKDTLVLDRTTQKYTHYLFFGVRTETEVQDIVSGAGENSSSP